MDVSFGVGVRIAGFGSARAVEAQRESARIAANAQSGRDVRGGSYSDGAPVSGPSEMVAVEQRTFNKTQQVREQQPVQQAARARAGGGATLGEAGGAVLYGRNGRLAEQGVTTANAPIRNTGNEARVAEAAAPIRLAPPSEPSYSVAQGGAAEQAPSPATAIERQIAPRRELAAVPTAGASEAGPRNADNAQRPSQAVRPAENDVGARERSERTPAPVVERVSNEQNDVMRQRLQVAYQIVPQATPASISLRA